MTEVHRYKVVKMLSEGGNRISYDPHGPEVVMAEAYDQLKAENEALRNALGDLLALYEDDEGCRSLPEYIAGRGAMAKESSHG